MVPALELTEEEVLKRLKKILKGVSVVPHTVPEYRADNPCSCCKLFIFCEYFILYISFVVSIFIFISLISLVVVRYLQDLGRNFVDSIPADDNPSRVKAGENLTGASSTSKSQATTTLRSASIAEIVPYIEYVPHPVP
jgi:hypothetical protein